MAGTEKAPSKQKAILARLSFLVLLTPWPVLIDISRQPDWKWTPRHSATALAAVIKESLLCCLGVAALSAILLLLSGQFRNVWLPWLIWTLVCLGALYQFIMNNAHFYA